jgi:hypothetical protein
MRFSLFPTGLAILIGLVGGSLAQQKVPISFNDFHGYTGTVKYIQDVAKAYPNITELIEIGKSNLWQRPIYVLVISNMNTGTPIDKQIPLYYPRGEANNVTPMKSYHAKPGQWIDGGMHGNEFTGTEVCVYIIDKLVSGYGRDREITALIDKNVFYICPVVNPDGVFNSVDKDISQRQNSMLIDNDNDGRINEDGPDDINGDGHITQFRYKDPNGRYVIDDVDPRLMVQIQDSSAFGTKQRYSVVIEDIDNDNDGRRGEDNEAGIDVNRNFPEGWWRDNTLPGGTGDYPTSSPEAHALVEFWINHTNIIIAQNFHTSGGFTYRPPGTGPENVNLTQKDIAVYDQIMGKKYIELNGLAVPEAWKDPNILSLTKAALQDTSKNKYAIARGYELPISIWRASWNETRDTRYGYGMVIDWMYSQFGAYGMTTELWNTQRDMRGIPSFTGETAGVQRSRALLKYQTDKFGGKFFIPWKPTRHPQLGDGEVGGWIPKYIGGNAFPGESLERVCEIHWQFEKFKAGLLPDVNITSTVAKYLYAADDPQEVVDALSVPTGASYKGKASGKYRVYEITTLVENDGNLATQLARGANLPGNRQDVVWLIGERNKVKYIQGSTVAQLGVLEGIMTLPPYTEPAPAAGAGRRGGGGGGIAGGGRGGAGQRVTQLPSKIASPAPNKRQITWIVAVEGNSPLKVILSSQKGGTKVKELAIR